MKKTFLVSACCTIMLAISSLVYSAEGTYLNGNLGIAIPTDSDVTDSEAPGITLEIESDLGIALGGAVGYAFDNNMRIEGEIAYQKNDLDKANLFGMSVDLSGDISSLAFLFNGYYDFVNETAFTPFIGGGLGFAMVDVNDFNVPGSGLPSEDEDDTVFAYQVGVGVGYEVNDNVTLDVKYRYFGTSDPDFDTSTAEYSSHNFYFGLRYSF